MSDEAKALEQIADKVLKKWDYIKRPQPVDSDAVRSAQRFLDAGGESVSLTLLNFRLAREFTKAADKKDPRGRLQNSEMDLLRAAIVFAGASLDTTLKELIRCALPRVVAVNELARGKFERFTADYLGSRRNALDFESLAEILTSPANPRQALLQSYARALTGESLQSVAQVSSAAAALGVSDPALRKRMADKSVLDEMFQARNQIVHELDLTQSGVRFRRIDETTKWVTEALTIGQEIINSVAKETSASV